MFIPLSQNLSKIVDLNEVSTIQFLDDTSFNVVLKDGKSIRVLVLENDCFQFNLENKIMRYKNGQKHFDFGPAVVYLIDEKHKNSEWWINDSKITDENQHVIRSFTNKEKKYFVWRNKNGDQHRPETGPFARDDHHPVDFDHPSEPCEDGSIGKWWMSNHEINRNPDILAGGGPAKIEKDGDQYYMTNGVFHNPFGPAIIKTNGEKTWMIDSEEITDEE